MLMFILSTLNTFLYYICYKQNPIVLNNCLPQKITIKRKLNLELFNLRPQLRSHVFWGLSHFSGDKSYEI